MKRYLGMRAILFQNEANMVDKTRRLTRHSKATIRQKSPKNAVESPVIRGHELSLITYPLRHCYIAECVSENLP